MNVMDVIGTNPTLKQNIELPISKIFKNNSQTATMDLRTCIKTRQSCNCHYLKKIVCGWIE